LAFSLAIQVLAILMAGTRTALLALLFVMPIAIFLLARYRRQLPCSDWPAAGQRWALIIFLGTVLGLGNLPGNNPSIAVEGKNFTPIERGIVRAGSVLKTSEYLTGSFSLRTDMWKASARMIEANPWTGVGAGSWEVQVPRYHHRDTSSELDFYAHNEAIQLLAEYGLIVGGLSLAFLLAYLLLSAQTNLTLSVDQRAEGPVRVAALCSLLALLLVSNAGFPLHLAATGALLALCLALLAGSDIRLDRPGAVKSSPFSTLVAGWSLAGCAMGLMAAIAISVQAIQAEQALISTTKLMLQSLRAQQSEGKPAKPEAAAVLVASAREAMSLNPHYRKLLNNLGSLLAVQGQWGPAIEVWETIARSRPHIADIWANLVQGHSQLGNRQAASAALARLNELQPTSLRTRRLEILLMSRGGQESAAAEKLREHYRTGNFDLNLVQAGYSLGMEMKNPALAREALALQVRMWPDVDPAVHQKMEALKQAQKTIYPGKD
jgi:tetratricopeptide (TPR) repeat protein